MWRVIQRFSLTKCLEILCINIPHLSLATPCLIHTGDATSGMSRVSSRCACTAVGQSFRTVRKLLKIPFWLRRSEQTNRAGLLAMFALLIIFFPGSWCCAETLWIDRNSAPMDQGDINRKSKQADTGQSGTFLTSLSEIAIFRVHLCI